jgi:hypothetical protein
MKSLLEKTKKHLEDQNETYFEHMWGAWKIVYILKVLELKCLVHSVVPFLYTEAVSGKIECLQKMTKRNK